MYSLARNEKKQLYSVHLSGKCFTIDDAPDIFEQFQNPKRSKLRKNKWRVEEDTNYLYTLDSNSRKIYYCNMIKNHRHCTDDYIHFVDGDPYNLKIDNIVIKNKFLEICEKTIIEKYAPHGNIELVHYHSCKSGLHSSKIRNPIWKINEDHPYLVVFCEPHHFIKYNVEKLEELKPRDMTWDNDENCVISIKRKIRNNGTHIVKLDQAKKSTEDSITKPFEQYLMSQNYKLLKYYSGHYTKFDKFTNPMWLVTDAKDETYVIMYIKAIDQQKNEYVYTILDEADLSYLICSKTGNPFSWHLCNSYIACKNANGVNMYLHGHLMHYNKEHRSKNLSIDHINQNKMDNRRSNLRIATQSLQNQNQGKKNRMKNARQLPDALVDYLESINKTNLPKFVTYNVDTVKGPRGDYQRDFFRIESTELLNRMGKKSWASSKSTKVSIVDKYKQTVEMIRAVQTQETDATTTAIKGLVIVDGKVIEKKTIPIPYTNMVYSRGKHCLVFDQRDATGKRLNLKMTIKTDYPTEADIAKFKINLQKKYPDMTV